MNLYQNKDNWLIEDQLDEKLVSKIDALVNANLDNFLKSKKNYSIFGENAEQYWLTKIDSKFFFKDQSFEDVKKLFKDEVLSRLKVSNILSKDVEEKINLTDTNTWTVLGEKNSYHVAHNHSPVLSFGISTVLYLKVPETNIEEEPDNNLFLILNSDLQNRYYNNSGNIVNINPEIGKLVIFPSWLIHGTYPQTEGTRQTFNQEYSFQNLFFNKSTFSYQ